MTLYLERLDLKNRAHIRLYIIYPKECTKVIKMHFNKDDSIFRKIRSRNLLLKIEYMLNYTLFILKYI